MLLSMTGYGRARRQCGDGDISVELKSVNARYFEYTSRVPRSMSFLEDKLKKLVNATISRGKVELSLTLTSISADEELCANMPLANRYAQTARELSEALNVPNDLTAASLLRMPDVLVLRRPQQDEEQLWRDVSAVAAEAIDSFVAMRAAEGEKLRADILSRLAFLESAVDEVEESSAGRVQKYTEKLHARLQALLEATDIDDQRILTEAAIFADKTAVDEETVRLRSHIKQYRDMLDADGPVGRKLDFLTQELNRETNTIGSKCNELAITRLVVDMKGEIEKIREQIQNIE